MNTGDLYEAIVDDAVYANLPAMVAEIVGARSGFIQTFQAGTLIDAQYSYCSETMVADIIQQHAGGLDAWADAGLRNLTPNRTGLIDDWVPTPTLMASRLWRIFQSHGDDTGHSMAILHNIDGTLMGLSVQRPLHHPFDRGDAAKLDAIAPDLHRIHRARTLLRARDDAASTVERLLDAGRSRTLLLGPDLLLVAASPGAQALLDAGDGLSVRAGRLVPQDARLANALRHAVNQTLHRRPLDQPTFLCPRDAGPDWRLLVLPMPSGDAAACAIVISGGELPVNRLQLWLDRHYHATPAEIDVALALLDGQSPEEISAQRAVSINTVRTQIRHLLDKTNSRGVNALVTLLMSLV